MHQYDLLFYNLQNNELFIQGYKKYMFLTQTRLVNLINTYLRLDDLYCVRGGDFKINVY